MYFDLIDAVAASDAHLAATVADSDVFDPFAGRSCHPWVVHSEVISQLLIGCLNRRELAVALIDAVSTPRGCSLEDDVRERVNRRLRSTALVQAVCLDSQTNDLLQVADMLASAIMNRRLAHKGRAGTPGSYKEQVARRLATAFGSVAFEDSRTERLNVHTLRRLPRTRSTPRLRVVSSPRSSG